MCASTSGVGLAVGRARTDVVVVEESSNAASGTGGGRGRVSQGSQERVTVPHVPRNDLSSMFRLECSREIVTRDRRGRFPRVNEGRRRFSPLFRRGQRRSSLRKALPA